MTNPTREAQVDESIEEHELFKMLQDKCGCGKLEACLILRELRPYLRTPPNAASVREGFERWYGDHLRKNYGSDDEEVAHALRTDGSVYAQANIQIMYFGYQAGQAASGTQPAAWEERERELVGALTKIAKGVRGTDDCSAMRMAQDIAIEALSTTQPREAKPEKEP